jgi:hypothetical protein
LSMTALKYGGRASRTHRVKAKAIHVRRRLLVKRKSVKALNGRMDKTSHLSSFTRGLTSSYVPIEKSNDLLSSSLYFQAADLLAHLKAQEVL